MTAPHDHSCPTCGSVIPSCAVIVDSGGDVHRECPTCQGVHPPEVTVQ